MADYTKNYNLKKPLPNEFYDVEDQNENMDILDTALAEHQKNTAVHLPKNGILPVERGGTGGTTAADARANLGAAGNHNLLDNWYFIDPVNRKGLTTYDTTKLQTYTIDRWWSIFANVSVSDNGLTLKDGGVSTYGGHLRQYVLNPKKLAGKTVTASVLVKELSGTCKLNMVKATGINSGLATIKTVTKLSVGINTFTATIPTDVGSTEYPFLVIMLAVDSGSGPLTIEAVKLELGSEQTLAHKENGRWVLNEIPNYAEQMSITSQYDNNGIYIGHPRITSGTTDITAGMTSLTNGDIYQVYQ